MIDNTKVKLAEAGTPLSRFQKERTDAISDMFDNVGDHGIYPTGKFFVRLDNIIETLLSEERNRVVDYIEEKIEKLVKESGKQDGTNTGAIGIRINELHWVLKQLK